VPGSFDSTTVRDTQEVRAGAGRSPDGDWQDPGLGLGW